MNQQWENLKDSAGFREFYFFAVALILAFGMLQTTGTALSTDRPVVSVVSCSMYPVYNVGDILMVKGVPYETIEEGDVIVYSTPESSIPVVHRVIEKNDDFLQTRGDNNRGQLDFEKHVDPGQIHGKVLVSVPKIGVLKLLAMDVTGVGGVNTDLPNGVLSLENTYFCREQV